MSHLFLLFSHQLTLDQTEDAQRSLGVSLTDIHYLPKELQQIFSNIPPELDMLNDYLSPIRNWLCQQSKPNDWILVQGDFGAVVHLVAFSKSCKLIPIYSTTQRVVTFEATTGEKRSYFKHVKFRKY